MLEKIRAEVKTIMGGDDDGHGFEHVSRVYDLAMDIGKKENADLEIVALAALLHDVDDYKLVGQAAAEGLPNAKRIMQKYKVDALVQKKVCDVIDNMGYSKALKGIRPQTIEGKVVSDADMMDAIGAVSVIRTLAYSFSKGKVIFDKNVFPESNLSVESYKLEKRKSDNFVNHFFDKLLKLKNMMFTKSAYEEAQVRQKVMIDFLTAFFRENNCPEWIEYLRNYCAELDKV